MFEKAPRTLLPVVFGGGIVYNKNTCEFLEISEFSAQIAVRRKAMHRTGIEDYYIIKDNKKLRFGYTTGTCAAAAAKAAARMLLTGERVSEVHIETPMGIPLNLEVQDITFAADAAECGIVKNGGDDPDATHGLVIMARVSKIAEGIVVDGGEGVGRVTKPGMQQAIGEAAINPVPMQMIRENVSEVMSEAHYGEGLKVVIFVPGGEKVAEKTFNPRLGIIGGISILGTRGIVEPMSERSLIASIKLDMEVHRKRGEDYLLVTPGNYGRTFAKNTLNLDVNQVVECSNYIGETLDGAVNLGFKGILFVSHVGKFIKVAAGIMNTHSRDADARAELMTAFALRAGADLQGVHQILESNTTDEALDMMEEQGVRQKAMEIAIERMQYYMQHRTGGAILTEAIIYGGKYGYLGATKGAMEMMDHFRSE